MHDKPRIGTVEWIHARPNVTAVFNSDYDETGERQDATHAPWTVAPQGRDWTRHPTHAEALAHALKEAEQHA